MLNKFCTSAFKGGLTTVFWYNSRKEWNLCSRAGSAGLFSIYYLHAGLPHGSHNMFSSILGSPRTTFSRKLR